MAVLFLQQFGLLLPARLLSAEAVGYAAGGTAVLDEARIPRL